MRISHIHVPESLLICLVSMGASQAAGQQLISPPRVYSAFIKQGSIVSGTINAIAPSAGAASGTLTIGITGELRGHLAGTQVALPFSTTQNPKYPPFAWSRVPPVTGHRVVLFLAGEPDQPYADEILDLDRGEERWMSELGSLLSLEASVARRDTRTLLDGLSSPDRDLRSLAAELLLVRVCGPADQCRLDALDKLAAVARNPGQREADRIWAVSIIAHSVFLGVPAAFAADRGAVKAIAEMLADPAIAIRDEAVQNLHGLLLGAGTAKPQVDIAPGDRARVVQQLRRDGESGVAFARQARELSDFFVKP